jgi:glycosyltransferase involved in cell wall biosynthesis
VTAPDATPLRVAALTQGARVPSTRFRVVQHLPHLQAAGLQVNHLPARAGAYPPLGLQQRALWLPATLWDAQRRARATHGADVCLLQRELVSTLRTAEPLIRCPMVFDVDDAIYLHPRGAQSDATARQARLIVCGNRVLAEHYAGLGPVEVVPTAVDTERFVPAANAGDTAPVIGWSGSSSGFAYLEMIEPALARVLDMHPAALFVVMAERAPRLPSLPPGRVRFVPWSEESEVARMQGFSVGLMPLMDDAWARGKCSFKMLTYMACGLPVVVSPVGMNADVLALAELGFAANHHDDWVQALDLLLRERDLALRLGRAGRAVAESHFSCDVIAPRLARLLRAAAS